MYSGSASYSEYSDPFSSSLSSLGFCNDNIVNISIIILQQILSMIIIFLPFLQHKVHQTHLCHNFF